MTEHRVNWGLSVMSQGGPSVYPSGLSREAEPTRLQVHVVLSLFSCVRLFVTAWTIAHQAPLSMDGMLQARTLECVAMRSSRGSSHPGIEPLSLPSPALAGGPLTTSTTGGELLQELAQAATETKKSHHLLFCKLETRCNSF